MIDVMTQAEDLESLENLHALCMLMQTIRASTSSPVRLPAATHTLTRPAPQ